MRDKRRPGRGEERRALGYSSTTDWLLLWATGVADANLAFLAGIGVALRKIREAWLRHVWQTRRRSVPSGHPKSHDDAQPTASQRGRSPR